MFVFSNASSTLECADGRITIGSSPGLGVEPRLQVLGPPMMIVTA